MEQHADGDKDLEDGKQMEQLGMVGDESEEEEMSEDHKAFYKRRTCTICDKIFHKTQCQIL